MIRSLWTAASGMNSQQTNMDTVANNLANVNTTGYRKVRAEFEDLIYTESRLSGTPATDDTVRPLDISVGHGSKVSATHRIFVQGTPQQTDVFSDMAIFGEGFFRVILPDGSYGYTRDGSFSLDGNGQFVTSQGYRLDPEIILPQGVNNETVKITEDGRIFAKLPPGGVEDIQIGEMRLYRFINPAGLNDMGSNIFKVSSASGDPIEGQATRDGMGMIKQRFIENSNVNMADEMVRMIVAQRAYEFNSKAIQTSDSMLGTAVSLKR